MSSSSSNSSLLHSSSSHSDILTNPKKQEILRKALLGVCKDMDHSIRDVGGESNSAETMKQRLKENPQKIFEEIAQDEEILKLIDDWIVDENKE